MILTYKQASHEILKYIYNLRLYIYFNIAPASRRGEVKYATAASLKKPAYFSLNGRGAFEENVFPAGKLREVVVFAARHQLSRRSAAG